MSAEINKIEIECLDPIELGKFWSAALNAPMGPGMKGVHIPHEGGSTQFSLYLTEGQDTRRSRSRARPWLSPVKGNLSKEVERLTALGAVVVEVRRAPASGAVCVVVMIDPEGNEFCVEPNEREVAEEVERFEREVDGAQDLMSGSPQEGAGSAFAWVDETAGRPMDEPTSGQQR